MSHRLFARTAAMAVFLLFIFGLAACGGGDQGGTDVAKGGPGSQCQPQVQLPTLEKGTLKVVAAQYPPLFTFENRKVGGVDGEILKQISKRACLDLEVELQSFAGVIESVASDRADMAAGGWYITPDREKVVDQSAPVYSDPPVIVAQEEITRLDELEGQTVGTTQGYLWVEDLKAWAGENAKLYQSPDAVFADVGIGRVDAGLMAVAEASYRLEQNPDANLEMGFLEPDPAINATVRPAVTNFPHRKGVKGFTEALDKEIARMRESGELASILKDHGIDPKAAEPRGA